MGVQWKDIGPLIMNSPEMWHKKGFPPSRLASSSTSEPFRIYLIFPHTYIHFEVNELIIQPTKQKTSRALSKCEKKYSHLII